MEHTKASQKDIDQILEILEQFGNSDTSRLNLKISDAVKGGDKQKEYHHGRCDIGSPWACGTAFDVIEEK